MKNSIIFLLLIAVFSCAEEKVSITEGLFSEKALGCGNFTVYRASADGLWRISVSGNREVLGLSSEPKTISIIDLMFSSDSRIGGSLIAVLEHFAVPPSGSYCGGASSERVSMAGSWQAVSGLVTAYVSEMNGREAVTVEIREMVFAGTEEDVRIGRLDFREVVFD
jgi:hypothetical protein